MKIIGVCGGSGSGKSSVASCLASFGGLALDTDEIYHELIAAPSPCVNALAEAFGDEILKDGAIHRPTLRRIVFADENKRLLLNSISHRFVTQEVDRRIKKAMIDSVPFVVIDAPLLLEAGMDECCDLVAAVVADRKKRIERIVKRDGISPEEAQERIDRQISDEELIPRCDAVIHNESDMESLEKQCRDLLVKMNLCVKDKE